MEPLLGRDLKVAVLADVESIGRSLVVDVLRPAGFQASLGIDDGRPVDVLLFDLTQLRGDPLLKLKKRRADGDQTPAIVLAAHFPVTYLRSLLQSDVQDFILKPYRNEEIVEAIKRLAFDQDKHVASAAGSLRPAAESVAVSGVAREEVRMLCEIGRAVASVDDLDSVLARVVEAAAFLTSAEEANIYLVEEESQEVVLRASKQAGERRATLQRLRITDTLAGQVFRSGKPVILQPFVASTPFKVQTGFLVQSLIKTPVRVNKQVVGVLGVYNRSTPRAFGEGNLALLENLAAWAGVALERASLLQEVRRQLSEGGASLPDLAEFLEEIERSVQDVLDDRLAFIPRERQNQLRAIQKRLQELQDRGRKGPPSSGAPQVVDLPAVIRQIAEEAQSKLDPEQVEVDAANPGIVPQFRGDPVGIRRIIEHLVTTLVGRTNKGRIALQAKRFEVSEGASPSMSLPPDATMADGTWAAVTISNSNSGEPPDALIALTGGPSGRTSAWRGAIEKGEDVQPELERLGGVIWHERSPRGAVITLALPMN